MTRPFHLTLLPEPPHNCRVVGPANNQQVQVVEQGGLSYFVTATTPEMMQAAETAGLQKVAAGVYAVAVTLHNSRVLEALGYPMAGFEAPRYLSDWVKHWGDDDLHTYQVATATFMMQHKRCIVANEPRTGKTISAIAARTALKQLGEVRANVMVSPLTVLYDVWASGILEESILRRDNLGHMTTDTSLATMFVIRDRGEIVQEIPRGRRIMRRVISGPAKAHEVLEEARLAMTRNKALKPWILIDPDIIRHNDKVYTTLSNMLASGEINCFDVDESDKYSGEDAGRTKAMQELLACAPYEGLYAALLNGTPGGPSKVFVQSKVVAPLTCVIDKRDWERLTMIPQGTLPIGHGRSIPRMVAREGWERRVRAYVPPIIRFETKDVLDVETAPVITTHTDMSAEQKEVYNMIMDEAILLIPGEAAGDATAIEHAATKRTKAKQAALGTFLSEEGDAVELNYTPRLEKITEIITAAAAKTIIFCCFKAPIWRLARDLEAKGIGCAVVTGDVVNTPTRKDRSNQLLKFRRDPECRVLICNPITTAYGIEGSVANTIIFNGSFTNGTEIYGQASSRCSSSAQNETVYIHHLISSPIEQISYESLESGVGEREAFTNYARERTVHVY